MLKVIKQHLENKILGPFLDLMALTVALLAYWAYNMIRFIIHGYHPPTDMIMQHAGYATLLFVPVVFYVVFVIGLHKENYKMVYVFYWFSVLEVLLTLGRLAWIMVNISGKPPRVWYSFMHSYSKIVQLTLDIVFNTLLPIYFIIVIRSEMLAIKGEGEQPATTADGETRVVLDAPVAKQQDRRYNFVYSCPEFEHKVNNTRPIFPVEELRIEKLRQQLG